jgi:hypothetical protein
MGVPKNGWFIRDNLIKMDDDWGYPFFMKPPFEYHGDLDPTSENLLLSGMSHQSAAPRLPPEQQKDFLPPPVPSAQTHVIDHMDAPRRNVWQLFHGC